MASKTSLFLTGLHALVLYRAKSDSPANFKTMTQTLICDILGNRKLILYVPMLPKNQPYHPLILLSKERIPLTVR